jgi:hypothetical protein
MVLVPLFAPLCRLLIASLASAEWGYKANFALAAVAKSAPSFCTKSLLVFKDDPHV